MFFLVLCKAHKVRSKTKSSPTLGVALAVPDARSPIPGDIPRVPHCSYPLHTMLKSRKTVSQCYSLFPVFGLLRGVTNKREQHATAPFACPKDWLCTLVPEEQAHCKSIMFPVARWMGKVPATCYNPFVMPIAGSMRMYFRYLLRKELCISSFQMEEE